MAVMCSAVVRRDYPAAKHHKQKYELLTLKYNHYG